MRRLREDLESGVLSLLKRRKKSILSVSGRREQVRRDLVIQHPRVQPEQVGKAPRLGHRRSWPEETATCCVTSWILSKFLMVTALLNGERKSPATNWSLSLEAQAPDYSSISQVPDWFCPPPFVQSRASLSNSLKTSDQMGHVVRAHHPQTEIPGSRYHQALSGRKSTSFGSPVDPLFSSLSDETCGYSVCWACPLVRLRRSGATHTYPWICPFVFSGLWQGTLLLSVYFRERRVNSHHSWICNLFSATGFL